MLRKFKSIFLWLILLPTTLFGFTFNANPTNETCAGNGSITFTASNTNPSGVLVYVVYKLPDTTTPYATVSTNFISGLSASTYRIIAQETVGSVVTTQQQDVVINNNIVPLTYSVVSLNQACSNTSNISVNIVSGVGMTYEIFAGPMLFPAQSSNTFSGLPVGVYKIRVFDNCGIGVVQTFTVNMNTAGIVIAAPTFANTSPSSCNFTVATNNISASAGTVIGYPLSVSYTVHPPDGTADLNYSLNVLNGNATSQDLVMTLPDYINQTYNYDITILDACGSTYTQNFIVDIGITLTSNIFVLDCNENYFSLTAANFTAPFALNFTSAPAGFDPSAFNTAYPGPNNQALVQFGNDVNIVPLGSYSVEIIDSCGRTTTRTFTIVFNPSVPFVVASNNGCLTNSGNIVVSISNFDIVTATITAAPSSYPNPLPHNVTSLIDANGILTINPVPLGDYTIVLTDNCSSVLSPVNCTVPIYVNQGLSSSIRPGCSLQTTSIELSSLNGKLTSVNLVSAPSTFSQPVPIVLTPNITANGKLYLDNLPAGNYNFIAIDECNFSNSVSVVAAGYAITKSDFSLAPNCGSFNIPLDFVSNGTTNQSFWLQKLIDSSANTWGNPSTNEPYPNGTLPTSSNSLQLNNNATNFNLSYNGTFRIVRHFLSYNNGVLINTGAVTSDKSCLEILSPTLSFNQALEIVDANRLPCTTSGNLDVIIEANGQGPLTYTITTKDGAPFFINNGNSNTFYNLPVGIYTFQVEDICGNIVNRIFDVDALLSLVAMTQPESILQCKDVILNNETFDISLQTPIIFGTQSPTDYTLTYHRSIADAQSAVNSITNLTNFDPTSNPQTIYARMIFNSLPSCYEVRSFDLIVGQTPKLNLDSDYLGCSTDPVEVDASTGNLATTTYSWSNGETTSSISVTTPGTTVLTVIATNTYGPGLFCTNTKEITVVISEQPEIDHFETVDWTVNENTITVVTSKNGAFEYSLDDATYQDSNVFTNLSPGVYTVYVKDKLGCGKVSREVWLLYYVRYFTPNGDGYNETWRIKDSQFEPELQVLVYDRYGKIMASFDANSEGWDGLYNGQPAVSDDYWFVVNRRDGRTHKGHFTLKR